MIRLFSLFLFFPCLVAAQQIALTFDDAPTPDGPLLSGVERSQKISEALTKHGAEAAFFVITSSIGRHNEERLNLYMRQGHVLANHSHTHPFIHEAGTSGYINDVQRADSILRRYPKYMRWFRYPYLDEGRKTSTRDSIRVALAEMQLLNGYVTIDNYDWYLNNLVKEARAANKNVNLAILKNIYIEHIFNSIVFYDSIARKHLGRSPKHVLLLHENDLSALFLGSLIDHLHKRGWKIISPREAYADPIAAHVPDVLFNGQGRVAAIAREKGIPARELIQESEDEQFLDELVRKRKVFE